MIYVKRIFISFVRKGASNKRCVRVHPPLFHAGDKQAELQPAAADNTQKIAAAEETQKPTSADGTQKPTAANEVEAPVHAGSKNPAAGVPAAASTPAAGSMPAGAGANK